MVAAPQFAGAGQLAIIGIQLLVQDQKAADLGAGERHILGEVIIHLGDLAGDQLIYFATACQVGIVGESDTAFLGPIADRIEVDVDEAGDEIVPIAERDRLFDVGEELELVFRGISGANNVPSFRRPTSLARSTTRRCPLSVNTPASPV